MFNRLPGPDRDDAVTAPCLASASDVGLVRRSPQQPARAHLGERNRSMDSDTWDVRPMRVATAPGSTADKGYRSRAALPESAAVAGGLPETRDHDLVFRGGKVIPHLAYVNFYVSGSSWSQSDIDAIDSALEAAM